MLSRYIARRAERALEWWSRPLRSPDHTAAIEKALDDLADWHWAPETSPGDQDYDRDRHREILAALVAEVSR